MPAGAQEVSRAAAEARAAPPVAAQAGPPVVAVAQEVSPADAAALQVDAAPAVTEVNLGESRGSQKPRGRPNPKSSSLSPLILGARARPQ